MSGKAHELYVYMNDMLVGVVQQKSNGILSFNYDASWLNWEFARPISLSMPLASKNYSGNIVYNFFDNLLPDSRSIRERIQRRFGTKTNNCFDLLYNIGADCAGALQLLNTPLNNQNNNQHLNKSILTEHKIAELLKHYRTAPLGMQANNDFRISIAGAQEKTALLKIKGKWYLPTGTTPTTHIIKLPIGIIEHSGIDLINSVENEWLCLMILQAFGLPVANASMEIFEDLKVLVVERFDRVWSENRQKILRIPQEDLCQALGVAPGLKYESDGGPGIKNIMDLLQGSVNAKSDRYNFMKSVFLFWILAAIDGHAKNFSLALEPGGNYKLQPLYDVISAFPLTINRKLELKKIKMAMAVNGKNRHYKWTEIKIRHWYETAELCKFSKLSMHAIVEEAFDRMPYILETIEQSLPTNFPENVFYPIKENMLALRNSLT